MVILSPMKLWKNQIKPIMQQSILPERPAYFKVESRQRGAQDAQSSTQNTRPQPMYFSADGVAQSLLAYLCITQI